MRRSRAYICYLFTASVAVMATFPVEAKTFYRYKNESGQMIMIDQLTPEALAAGYDVINEAGQLVQKVPPALTLGELEEEKERQLEKKRGERERQRQLRRDAELLRIFTSTDEIISARDAELAGIDQRRNINENRTALLKTSLEDLQRRAADYERTGRAIPEQMIKDIQETQQQIANRQQADTLIIDERERVKQKYEKDIVRFKELQAQRAAFRFQNATANNRDTSVSVVTCTDRKRCNDIWRLAQVYAQRNASGRLEVVTDTIILTAAPKIDNEMSIAFSRLPGKTETQVVLEINCNDSEAGKSLCNSSEAHKLTSGFEKFVAEQLD